MEKQQVIVGSEPLQFVSGKGGVGKSTVALVLAALSAQQGQRTLLVEMNTHSFYGRMLQITVQQEPVFVKHNLHVANWRSEECLREYVLHYLKLEALYELFFRNKVMRAFIEIAPGLSEIALLGKITSGLRKIGPRLEFDRIIIDCFATGDALALFRAPRGLADAVQVGPMGEQTRSIDKVLRDPQLSRYWLVSTFEELPAVESVEFAQKLKMDLGVDVHLIANRVYPELAAPTERHETTQEFVTHMLQQMRLQAQWRNYLKDKGLAASVELPFIYDVDSRLMIDQLMQTMLVKMGGH